MKNIESLEFTRERAVRDIEFCLGNAHTGKAMLANGGFFKENPHIYLNATDDIKRAVESTIKEGDTVLAVGASGDYMLDSIFYGADEVVNYDINPYQYYVCVLKLWAIQVLSYKEFINFFTNYDTKDHLDYKMLNKIIAPFEGEAAYPFWERFSKVRRLEQVAARQIINEMGPMLKMMVPQSTDAEIMYVTCANVGPNMMPQKFKAMRLINAPVTKLETLGYLSSEEAYNATRARLKDVKLSFVTASIEDVKDKLPEEKKFDVIFLSNIPFYMRKANYMEAINNQLLPLLTEDGLISVYHQGMRIRWFNGRLNDRKFKLQRVTKKEFDSSDLMYQINLESTGMLLDAHEEMLAQGLEVTLDEIPAFGGASGNSTDVDIVSTIRRR